MRLKRIEEDLTLTLTLTLHVTLTLHQSMRLKRIEEEAEERDRLAVAQKESAQSVCVLNMLFILVLIDYIAPLVT